MAFFLFQFKTHVKVLFRLFCYFRLKNQIPQIKQTLEILRHMQKKKVIYRLIDLFFSLHVLYTSSFPSVPVLFVHIFFNVFVCTQDTTDPMDTHFLLADNVYCKASVPPTDKVCLWLGVSL